MNKMLKYLLIGGAVYVAYRIFSVKHGTGLILSDSMSGLGDPNSEGSSGSEAAALDFARQSGGGTTVVTVPSGGSFMQKAAHAPERALKKALAPSIAITAFKNPNNAQAQQLAASNEFAKKLLESAKRGKKKYTETDNAFKKSFALKEEAKQKGAQILKLRDEEVELGRQHDPFRIDWDTLWRQTERDASFYDDEAELLARYRNTLLKDDDVDTWRTMEDEYNLGQASNEKVLARKLE